MTLQYCQYKNHASADRIISESPWINCQFIQNRCKCAIRGCELKSRIDFLDIINSRRLNFCVRGLAGPSNQASLEAYVWIFELHHCEHLNKVELD